MRYQDARVRELLAGEYVLGSLHGQARRRFETLLCRDPDLQALVNQWAQTLEPLNEHLEPVAPPPGVWSQIEQQIGTAPERLWSNVVFWRRLGVIAVAASVVLAFLIGIPPYQTPAPERIAFVTDATDKPVWLVSATPQSRTLRIKTLRPMNMPAGEFCVLWLVWKDGSNQGVTVLPDNMGVMSVELPKAMKQDPNKAELVVTVETGDDAVTNMQGKVMFKGPWSEL